MARGRIGIRMRSENRRRIGRRRKGKGGMRMRAMGMARGLWSVDGRLGRGRYTPKEEV